MCKNNYPISIKKERIKDVKRLKANASMQEHRSSKRIDAEIQNNVLERIDMSTYRS